MWPFSKPPAPRMSEVIEKAVDELDCHLHYEDYVSCVQKKQRNYRSCVEILDKYRFCMVSARLRQKQQSDPKVQQQALKELNPNVFSHN